MRLTAFITPGALPESLQEVAPRIETVGKKFEEDSAGRFLFSVVDPDDPESGITRQDLVDTYGLSPYPASLFSSDTYYLHMVLQSDGESSIIYPSGQMREDEIRSSIDAAIRRAVPGFLKTVGLWLPPQEPPPSPGRFPRSISSWSLAAEELAQNYILSSVDLTDGRVPAEVDVLVVIAPQEMTDPQRFAIDQFLMGGGAVVVAAGRYQLSPALLGGLLAVDELKGGLGEMLASYGVGVGDQLVMDPQNQPFPVRVERRVGGFRVSEVQRVDYPLFVDVRRDGMATESAVTTDLPAVTLHWATPLEIDEEKNLNREVMPLLWSTEGSWLSRSSAVEPDPANFPEFGFPVEGERRSRPLAVSIRGSFDSFFKGQSPPPREGEQGEQPELQAVIESSPETSRLLVIGSAEFLDDTVLDISRTLSGDRTLLNLQFLQNSVDWSLEDEELLGLRFRGTYSRLLKPLGEQEQTLWEALNYGVALVALIALGAVWTIRQRSELPILLADDGEEP